MSDLSTFMQRIWLAPVACLLLMMCFPLQAQWEELNIPEEAKTGQPLHVVTGPDQRPWLVFKEDADFNYGLSVVREAANGISWEFVGERNLHGKATPAGLGTAMLRFASDGRPWLVHSDTSGSRLVFVRAWNEATEEWEVIGNPIDPGPPASSTQYGIELVFDSHGHPIVAWRTNVFDDIDIEIYWLETEAAGWQKLPLFKGRDPVLRTGPDGAVYLGVIHDEQLLVRRLHEDHAGWDILGGDVVMGSGLWDFDLALDSAGRAWLLVDAYWAEGGLHLRRLKADESGWERFGPDIVNTSHSLSLAIDSHGRFYAFWSYATDPYGDYTFGLVERLSEDGQTWEVLEEDLEMQYLNRKFAHADGIGHVYFAYKQRWNTGHSDMILRRWTGEAPSMIFSSRFELDQ